MGRGSRRAGGQEPSAGQGCEAREVAGRAPRDPVGRKPWSKNGTSGSASCTNRRREGPTQDFGERALHKQKRGSHAGLQGAHTAQAGEERAPRRDFRGITKPVFVSSKEPAPLT